MSIIKVYVALIALIVRCDILLASKETKDSWPSGSYSLPKPLSGCPKFWKEGWLRQDLEDGGKTNTKFHSKFSLNFHMNAGIVKKEFVDRTFCTKVTNTFSTVWNLWPKDSWPSGNYSLPKPLSGCPKFWKEGWLKQDLEDDAIPRTKFLSKFSSNFHMNASIVKKEFVERTFCTKVTDTFSTAWNLWPKGFYCIYKFTSCPDGMVEGSILWDDENTYNGNNKRGTLPYLETGYYNEDTMLFYCCQNQGKWYRPIELPTEKPFYLLPYGSRNCQRVVGAISSLEFIIYDTEDNYNHDRFGGHHVFTDKVKSLPKIYYCYYEGCQYKLQDNNGSFSSPNFANNSYSDFQVCSWEITVNISLKISLSFLTLNISSCEENYLEIYDGSSNNNGLTLLAKFCDENATSGARVVSKANSLYIVLKSGNNSARNTEDSSKGLEFYAKYDAFQQVTTTTTSKTTSSKTTSSKTTSFTKPTNTTFDGRRKDLQNADSENSATYLSIILPIFAILIVLGVVGAVLYWRRRNNENDVTTPAVQKPNEATDRYVSPTSFISSSTGSGTSTETINPIYDSEENTVRQAHGNEAIEMYNTTSDNVLYEPANELFEGNPIYQETDYDNDETYAEPNE